VEFNHAACERLADGDRMGTGANDPNPSELAERKAGGRSNPPAHHTTHTFRVCNSRAPSPGDRSATSHSIRLNGC
jgi:hypothetical protein